MGWIEDLGGTIGDIGNAVASPVGALLNPMTAGQAFAAKKAAQGLTKQPQSLADQLLQPGQIQSYQDIMGQLPETPRMDLSDILEARKKGLGGYTSEESNAMRSQMAAQLGRQGQAQQRQLLAAQAKAGVRGGAAASQGQRLIQNIGAQRAAGEQDLFIKNIAEQQRRQQQYDDLLKSQRMANLAADITRQQMVQSERESQRQVEAAKIPAAAQLESARKKCVIATHAVESGAFTRREKLEAIRWCEGALHGTWWGESMRRGYRWIGNRKISQGKAANHYSEFQRYVRFGNGKDRSLKAFVTFAARSVQMFVIGLFVKE